MNSSCRHNISWIRKLLQSVAFPLVSTHITFSFEDRTHLPDLKCYLHFFGEISLGIHLGDIGSAVAEDYLRRFQAKLSADFRRCRIPAR